jgi:hypothetical protein
MPVGNDATAADGTLAARPYAGFENYIRERGLRAGGSFAKSRISGMNIAKGSSTPARPAETKEALVPSSSDMPRENPD